MRILFDLQILYPERWDTMSSQDSRLFEEIHNSTYDRIYILKDEIEKEELQADIVGRKNVFLSIFLTTNPKRLQPLGYSEELTLKILSCFNDYDVDSMWDRVENIIKSLLN